MTKQAAATSYDEIPYDGAAFGLSHPDHVATVAHLLGAETPDVSDCRVLELACGVGGNLIPMALTMPGSEFVGVDLSGKQIEMAKQAAEQTGASNVRLLKMDLSSLPEDLGQFDFIIAHGVYSWVSAGVRDALMSACKRHLAPSGAACISYNTYPGWKMRGMVRDVMLYHTREIKDPQERINQAKAVLDFLCQAPPERLSEYAAVFKTEQKIHQQVSRDDSYLFHELLEEDNNPVYFHQFAAHAQSHGLQFLCESELSSMQTDSLPPIVEQTLSQLGGDIVAREQYFDFVINQLFRSSLLIHADAQPDRVLRAERLNGLYVAGPMECEVESPNLRSGEPITFKGLQGVEATTRHPICKAAFDHLRQIWPASISLEELEAAARKPVYDEVALIDPGHWRRERETLAGSILRLYRNGVLELHRLSDPFVTYVSEKPEASAWARLCAQQGRRPPNRRHAMVDVNPVQNAVLPLLDGSRSHDELVDALAEIVAGKELVVQRSGRPVEGPQETREAIAEALQSALKRLAKSALLVG